MTASAHLLAASALLGLDPDNPLLAFLEEIIEEDDDQPPEYIFVGRVGRSRVTAKQLVEFRYCDASITAATGEVVDHLTPGEWRKARRALLAAKTQEVLGPEAAAVSAVRRRLLAELRRAPDLLQEVEDQDDREYRFSEGYPFRAEGHVWLSVDRLLERLEREKVRHDPREVMRGLKAMGMTERRRFWFYDRDYARPDRRGQRRTRTMYMVPEDIVNEALGLDEE